MIEILIFYLHLESSIVIGKLIVQSWLKLADQIAPEIAIAPKTYGDPHNANDWSVIPEKVTQYLERNIIEHPWGNTLVLLSAVMAGRRYEMSSIINKLTILHGRF